MCVHTHTHTHTHTALVTSNKIPCIRQELILHSCKMEWNVMEWEEMRWNRMNQNNIE